MIKLRKVASSDKKDKSASPNVGRVLYKQTEHSQQVEEREQMQAVEASDEVDTQPEPNRAFRQDLLNALQGGRTGLGTATRDFVTAMRKCSYSNKLTAESRVLMIADDTLQLLESESAEKAIVTLATQVATAWLEL
jgi:hypothetical protein